MDITGLNNGMLQYYQELTKNTEGSAEFNKLLEDIKKEQDDARLKEACEAFESYFLKQLYTDMRKTIPENEMLTKSPGREMYEDMLYDEYARLSASGSGAGLARMLYKQLSKEYGNANGKTD